MINHFDIPCLEEAPLGFEDSLTCTEASEKVTYLASDFCSFLSECFYGYRVLLGARIRRITDSNLWTNVLVTEDQQTWFPWVCMNDLYSDD